MSNKYSKGSIKIQFTGYIELNGVELVNCDTNTIEQEFEVADKNSILVWKRVKADPTEYGMFKLYFSDDVENYLLIQNAPSYDGVKVSLNGKNITGKHYF